ncbi:aminotransferase class III-fold pyridoxal phosphate-dependent enzyme [Sphingobacterium sp. UT-1RO-CII-1]|uniref:aspartate aminotransferase family protein n=1 Tax=Sphingobacterium sp. UT-1RO-CII-1 TaxID=2995225 RepID=UPI00227C20C8|nr:aminotransferase class III-fold pyridoxal phosphate-dependent enzyme [Sphingobacterium sp. UT-1RO-CII-1]MCY4779409.1 aminotransferase class III-fold pyridoxal phosphate-dependent enzyme [Sphingobacterium sp. UT-1RO-CII-1]
MKLFDVFEKLPVNLVRGKGNYVYDDKNFSYLDLYGGHGVISIGHSHPHYVSEVTKQLHALAFYSNTIENSLQSTLAHRIGVLSNYEDYQIFFSNTGAEANENALKIASFHTGRSQVIAFSKSFHGRTSAAVAATDIEALRAPINQSDKVVFMPFNDIDSVRKLLKTNEFCAVIIEAIQGVAGVYVADDLFLQELQQACKETGTMLIVDEIQSGYGRSGKFFSHQYAGVKPDLITVAKGIANGYPMAATLISPFIEAKVGQLGTTFGGNHLACAAALSVLDVLEDEGLVNNVAEVGDYLMSELLNVKGVIAVRGRGLMIGVDFDYPIIQLRHKLLVDEYVFTGYSGNYTLRLLPALTFTKELTDIFISKLKKVIEDASR